MVTWLRVACLTLVALGVTVHGALGGALWTPLDAAAIPEASGERAIVPDRALFVRLDPGVLQAILAAAPSEHAAPQGVDGLELALPILGGGERRYRVVDSPVMAPGLAGRYPEIRTFRLVDIADPALGGRGDWTPHGFHAMVRTPDGTLFVDPYRLGDALHHQVYLRSDLRPLPGRELHCEVHGEAPIPLDDGPDGRQSTLDLRTYRLAVAATGEYTTYHGGSVAAGLAAIVTAVNRVNEVYERDLAIRMILVANNDQIVYTNGGTDPYSNNDGVAMLSQNQTNVDAVIGSANYDLGHVFSTGGGGVANLGVTCRAGWKARGVTGLPQPVGDPFYVDYVAHEMGHQWGANHTFNAVSGGCGGGNRNASTAYEPGSGSTIMAYAGLCAPANLQPASDAYFHRASLDEIIAYSRSGAGNGCAVTVAAGNNLPSVDAGPSFTIPASTPFTLSGSASDLDGDALTYCWEEYDLGPAGHPSSPSGNAPILRSFNPTASPSRTLPKLTDLLNNTSTIGERLPTYDRTMSFRLTVRDNRAPAGGLGVAGTTVTVASAAGPFLVTAPNTAVVWDGAGPHTVSWNPAGTDQPPVSCASVDILLSTDGGVSFPVTLLAGTPNDGSEAVTVSVADTSSARVKVACNGNVFFDLSNTNFTIVNAFDLIFADGFESGGTSLWSAQAP